MSIRGASQINDQEFLAAYNDKTKTNAQVIESLNTDWTAVGVKLRSARVTLHTIVERTGGKAGTFTDRSEPLALEAQIWQKHGIVQPQPNGPYVSLKERLDAGKIAIDGDLNVTEVTAAAATTSAAATTEQGSVPAATAETTAANQTGTEAPKAPEFAFTAEIFGSNYRLAGPTKDDALHALFMKLQELNFSKVAITNKRTGGSIGINDIQNGGEYRLNKQLTAAGDAPSDEEIDDVLNGCMEAENSGSSKWPGMSYEQGVAAAIRWMRGEEQNPLDD
jgi:hypothetical protein